MLRGENANELNRRQGSRMAVRPRSGGGLLCGGLAGQAGREVDVNWYCLDCLVSGPLNRQGRCATCGSNAVTESEGRGNGSISKNRIRADSSNVAYIRRGSIDVFANEVDGELPVYSVRAGESFRNRSSERVSSVLAEFPVCFIVQRGK